LSLAPIGILGGTFDPIHNGHLRLAQEAFEQCGLTKVHFIPSGVPPHRSIPHANITERLDMVRLALQGNATFVMDEREAHRTAPCYMIDTLRTLRADFDMQQPLCLLMGGDAFLLLHLWHQWKSLFELAHIVVMQRAGCQPFGNAINKANNALCEEYKRRLVPASCALRDSSAGAIFVANMPAIEISATDIRRRCADKKDVRYLLPDAVVNHIQSHHLYTS